MPRSDICRIQFVPGPKKGDGRGIETRRTFTRFFIRNINKSFKFPPTVSYFLMNYILIKTSFTSFFGDKVFSEMTDFQREENGKSEHFGNIRLKI